MTGLFISSPMSCLDFALVFSGSKEETSLEVYTDASWSPTGEKSPSGLCVYYRGNLVAWNSKRQSLVALSSAEAELIACVSGAQLGLCLRAQLEEWFRRIRNSLFTVAMPL
eukprot:4330931-Amphidinium_carterae.1